MFDHGARHAAWTSPLLPSADGLAQRYSVASGQPLAHWEFYMALAYFKLAIIAAGIDFRARMAPARKEAGHVDPVGEAVAPLIARGPEPICEATIYRTPSGLRGSSGRAAQLNDPRGAGQHGDQPAAHRRQQDGHPQLQGPVPAEEGEACTASVF